jgi:dsDNA-specific endonuclease/ATPase MutS2
MSFSINDLDTGQLIGLSNALAISFSIGLTPSEIEILGAVITATGDLMALIASKQQSIKEAAEAAEAE